MKSSQPYTLLKYPARFTVVDLLHDLEAMGMDEDIIIKSYGEKSRHTDPPCLSMATYAALNPQVVMWALVPMLHFTSYVVACAHTTQPRTRNTCSIATARNEYGWLDQLQSICPGITLRADIATYVYPTSDTGGARGITLARIQPGFGFSNCL